MATTEAIHRHPISAHLEPLARSTPVSQGPYSTRLHPVLCSRATPEVQSHRQKIVKEIFDTEHSYISQLNTIVTLFLKPIRVGCLLPPDATAAIFSNVEGIHSVNLELFTCMRQHSLGEAFSYLAPFLKLYSTYAANFLTANETLQAWLKRSPDFAHFVSSQESRPECCQLSLSTLIITPIQRIPRYKLLLENLLRHTKPTYPDYSKLNVASAQVAAVASHINEYIRKHENFRHMLAIQNRLTGPCVPGILAPGRSYIQEGRIMKVCRRKAKERMVFLFSDMLIYARPNSPEKTDATSTYECRCVLPLLNSSVQVVPTDPRAPGVSPLFKVSNEEMSLLFFSYSQEEVYQWAQAIESTIRSLQLAFGSLVTTETVDLLRTGSGEVALGETPLSPGTEYNLDSSPPMSPYPLTATMMSSHSLEGGKRDSGFSEQPGAETLRFLGAHVSGEPAPAGRDTSGTTWLPKERPRQNGLESQDDGFERGSIPRPKSSGVAGPTGTGIEGLTSAVVARRPQSTMSAATVASGSNPGDGAGWAKEGAEVGRRKPRHKSKSKGHHQHRDTEETAVVIVNEHVLRESDGEEMLEVPDETSAPPTIANGGRASQLRTGLHPLSSGSLPSNLAQSRCCTIS